MKVGIRLQAILRRYRPAGVRADVVEMDLAEAATVGDAAAALGVPSELIHAVFVNDRQVTLETKLAPGDMVRIFPPVVGG